MVSWGVFGSYWWNTAVVGAPYTAYARKLGASPLVLGVLSGAILLGVVGQVISSYLVERTGRRKAILLTALLLQRPLWTLVGALPFLIPPHLAQWRLAGLFALTFTSSVLGGIGGPAWTSWMAYVIPERIRAQFLAARYQLATITGMLSALLVGKILDWNDSFTSFLVLFVVAGVMGTIDILMFIFVPAHDHKPEQAPALAGVLAIPWRDRLFRRYLYYTAMSAATYGIVGQFGMLYLLEYARLGKLLSNWYGLTLPLLVAALLGPACGRYIARFGNRPMLIVGTILALPLPITYNITGPHSHILLTATALTAGVVTAIVGVAEINMMFALTPEEKRSTYLAAVSATAGLVGAAAPMVGGIIAQALSGWVWVVWDFPVRNLHAVFAVAVLLRILHVVFFVPRLPETHARSPRELVAEVIRSHGEVVAGAARRIRGR